MGIATHLDKTNGCNIVRFTRNLVLRVMIRVLQLYYFKKRCDDMYSEKMWKELFKNLPFCEYGECPYRDIKMENKCEMLCEVMHTSEDALDYVDVDVDLLLEEGLV